MIQLGLVDKKKLEAFKPIVAEIMPSELKESGDALVISIDVGCESILRQCENDEDLSDIKTYYKRDQLTFYLKPAKL